MTIDSPISGPPLGQIASYDQLPPISNRPGTMADQVQAVLLEAILDGTLPPGTHLKAEGLTRRYGISIIPVREALRTLQAGGWVDIRPHHGLADALGHRHDPGVGIGVDVLPLVDL
ncbi:GntR family transcriptional regulator, partial [Mycolicibacterium sphagni]|uniref:GntR family transcriptional regulator n=1 Tax=Mycolicibacterium sphagni TaxID=1786 RepID=UPI0021F302A6